MISFYTICMRIFATLYEDICHFVWRYSPLFMRIFAYKKMPWSLVKFFQLILEGNIWYHFTQFVWWYSPHCMRIFATLYEDIRHFKNKKETGPSKLSQAKDVWDRYWECAIQLFAHLFSLSPISKTVSEVFC